MSRKKRKDYVGVFRAMKEKVGGEMRVQQFMADFELPVWQAVQLEFPNAAMKGCTFHWTQCLWRRVDTIIIINN